MDNYGAFRTACVFMINVTLEGMNPDVDNAGVSYIQAYPGSHQSERPDPSDYGHQGQVRDGTDPDNRRDIHHCHQYEKNTGG